MSSSRERGFAVTPEKLAFIEQKMREIGLENQEALIEATGLSNDVIRKKLFNGEKGGKLDKSSIEAIAKALKIQPKEIVDEWHQRSSRTKVQPSTTPAKPSSEFWQNLCRGMLPIELDANPLISGDGVTLGIEDIVPLDLVERKQRPKVTHDPSPERFQQALEDQEVSLSYSRFFDNALASCQSIKEGKGLAIIGEPGAGKTTLLCAIADWIIKQGDLPVFIRLKDFNTNTSLEDYLLKIWLKQAICKRESPEQRQDELVEHFNAGRVWLLLDGVDEMAQSNQSLQILTQEFKGWIANARIVLTCRVNIWEVNRNDLRSKFLVYRSRGFGDEDQARFIQSFFQKASEPETGIELKEKLKTANRRLQDLVKSPLWLTLLCRTWKWGNGKLPETKAELYSQFVKSFYDWKNNPHIPEEKRPLLEQGLGELAKKAIEQESSRFSLREGFIRQELDKFDPSFFDIACKLGWLNILGGASRDPSESVYSFFHPTFQEYFATLAIADWEYFLPRDHSNDNPRPVTGKVYRIFNPQWREVILLWLGQPSEQLNKQHKEQFIQALVEFEDRCQNLYRYQAYLIALRGISEFPDCTLSNQVIRQAIDSCIGCFDAEEKVWKRRPIFFVNGDFLEELEAALLETDARRSIAFLSSIIRDCQDDEIKLRACETLGKIDQNNKLAISSVLDIFRNNQDPAQHVKISPWAAVSSLKTLNPGNTEAISILIEIINTTQDDGILISAIHSLANISNGDSGAINTLINLLKTNQTEDVYNNIICALGLTGNANPDILDALIGIIQNNKSDILRRQAIGSLGVLCVGEDKVIQVLIDLIRDDKNHDWWLIQGAIESLGKISFDKPDVLANLKEYLYKNFSNLFVRDTVIKELAKINSSDPDIIRFLINLLDRSSENVKEITMHGLREFAIKSLGEVAIGNQGAVEVLVQQLSIDQHWVYSQIIVSSIGKIGKGNPVAIQGLVNFLQQPKDQSLRLLIHVALNLHRIDKNNLEALMVLVFAVDILCKNLSDIETEMFSSTFANELRINFSKNLFYITIPILKKYLDESLVFFSIFQCAQNMSYPEFYQAWNMELLEGAENIPDSDTLKTHSLETHFLDLSLQSKLVKNAYLLTIDIRAFVSEKDERMIAQEFINQIYETVFLGEEIPEINHVTEIKRRVPIIAKQLQVKNLVFILQNGDPYPELITFCQKLKTSKNIHIAWITNQPLEPPLKGFPPDQVNLISAIQSWLEELAI